MCVYSVCVCVCACVCVCVLLTAMLLYIDIISVFPPSTVDIADYEVGEKVPIEIEVQTCLPDYDISVYKGKDRVFYAPVRNARESSVKVLYHLTVSNSSVGQYAARVTADAASTRLTYFNVTGV